MKEEETDMRLWSDAEGYRTTRLGEELRGFGFVIVCGCMFGFGFALATCLVYGLLGLL